MSIIIAPSILSADFSNLEKEIKKVEDAGADWIHIDVMDGHFVPNITIGACVVKDIRKVTKLPLDCHLMIENPGQYIEDFAKAGADYIVFHYEATKEKTGATIELIKSFNVKVGLSIKPQTPIDDDIIKFLPLLDMFLVMSVEPGFSGQSFIEETALKVKKVKELNKKIILQVDGGINEETAKICVECGANCLVSGNYIFKSRNVKKAIELIKNGK